MRTMRTKSIIAIALVFSCVACSNNGILEDTSNTKDVEVVNLKDFADNTTRSIANQDQEVLRFKDYSTYQKTLKELHPMTIEQRQVFFNKIGFKGAYSSLMDADNELDKIFDIEDNNSFLEAYGKFKEKYKNIYVFNTANTYDLSPYLPFTDNNLELLGSNEGYLIVGDEIISPNNDKPNYKSDAVKANTRVGMPLNPIHPKFTELPGDCGVVIKKGKYRSDIYLGIDKFGNIFMVRAASQKKKALWSRRHPTNYEADLYIENNGLHISMPNNGESGAKENVLPINARQFAGKTIKAGFKNFRTGCCGGVVGNKEFSFTL